MISLNAVEKKHGNACQALQKINEALKDHSVQAQAVGGTVVVFDGGQRADLNPEGSLVGEKHRGLGNKSSEGDLHIAGRAQEDDAGSWISHQQRGEQREAGDRGAVHIHLPGAVAGGDQQGKRRVVAGEMNANAIPAPAGMNEAWGVERGDGPGAVIERWLRPCGIVADVDAPTLSQFEGSVRPRADVDRLGPGKSGC